MKKDDYYRLRNLYPRLAHYELLSVPDGWLEVTEHLLAELDAIQPPEVGVYGSPLPLKILCSDGFAVAMVTANPGLGTWTPDKAMAVIEAIMRFNQATSKRCQLCGQPSSIIVKEWDGSRQQRLCQHHADERLAEYERGTVQ